MEEWKLQSFVSGFNVAASLEVIISFGTVSPVHIVLWIVMPNYHTYYAQIQYAITSIPLGLFHFHTVIKFTCHILLDIIVE